MKVVVLLVDTLRYDFMGFNSGGNIRTPNMDRLATRSLIFDKAYLGSYPCMPARRDICTGKFEFPFRGWGPLEYYDKDLATVLTVENGITSMIITDHYHLWEKGSGNYHFEFSGYEFVRGQEYDKWKVGPDEAYFYKMTEKQGAHLKEGYLEQNQRNVKLRTTEKDYFPAKLMTLAADWVEENHERDDFFLMIDCFDPHEPFDPPRHYVDLYDPYYEGEETVWPTYGWNKLTEEETKHVRALYAGELTMVDYWIGYLLDRFEQLRMMDDTMIVLTTDHGHMFGEHGIMGKPWSGISDSNMYEEVSHVPLVVYHPKLQQPGRRNDGLVQLVDLYPTILDAFGIKPPAGTHGKSMLPLILDEDVERAGREVACYGRFGEAFNITDGEWTLFIWPPGEENAPLYWHSQLPPQFGPYELVGPFEDGEDPCFPVACARGEMATQLFNVSNDPQQLRDQAAEHPEVVEHFRSRAAMFLKSIEAPHEQFERLGLTSLREVEVSLHTGPNKPPARNRESSAQRK